MQPINNKEYHKGSVRPWFRIGYKNGFNDGYEDGMKAGLKRGNEILEQLLKEHQHKIDKILVYRGE